MKALPPSKVGAAIQTVETTDAHWATMTAFKFLTLTATRSGEIRHATWTEIDLTAAIWTIPAEHTKTQQVHRVPLSSGALAVLDAARRLSRREWSGLSLAYRTANQQRHHEQTVQREQCGLCTARDEKLVSGLVRRNRC